MRDTFRHLSDEELLCYADGESPSGQTSVVRSHLASCWECRARLRQTEQSITDFVQVHHDTLDPQLPPAAGPRALLRARLAEQANAAPPSRLLLWPRAKKIAYVAAVLLATASAALFVYRTVEPPVASARAVPDPRLTPGAARLVSSSEVCKVSVSDDTQLLPVSLQQQVLQEYGLSKSKARGYELDYLISPQLGGTDDLRNLWPEPASSTWNIQAKDALEDRLHQLVCEGKINLATAQRDLSTDWISAYKKYFHTDRPL